MKNLIILLFIVQQGLAATHYVKIGGGTGTGISDATAWSYYKLNRTNLSPGDIVLFRRGDIFYGALSVRNGVTYGSYGNGSNPKITGLTTLSVWTQYSDNIYYTSLDVPELNIVLFDASLQGMGRYPKTGYLTYNSHSGNSAITGSSISAIPFDPTGAEVVIRKIRQITDRHIVTSVSGNTINISDTGAFGTNFSNNTSIAPTDGYGYFIQSSLNTITEMGEWYYDDIANRLYMHFGNDTPASHTVIVSTIPVLVQMDNKSDLTFQKIDFEGSNKDVVNTNNTDNITFSDCNFSFSKNAIITGNRTNDFTIEGGTIEELVNSAIIMQQNVTNISIDNVTFNNIGQIPGMGGSGDAMQLGIWIDDVIGATVSNCNMTNIGYHGIVIHGKNTLIEHNTIDTYGFVKDDCAAIYAFQFENIISSNNIIRENTIRNGLGAGEGVASYLKNFEASGIYLDANVNNYEVYSNNIHDCNYSGILLVDIGNHISLHDNTVVNCYEGALQIWQYDNKTRNLQCYNNKFSGKEAGQMAIYIHLYHPDEFASFGNFHSNNYTYINNKKIICLNREYEGGGGKSCITLSDWQRTYSKD